ncbi:hypothetical protein U1Q18_002612 [Sarracenia purpurea var. burkii]
MHVVIVDIDLRSPYWKQAICAEIGGGAGNVLLGNDLLAVEIGKQLARKHFIHHVFGENEFEDGNHFYRFLEHEPFIPRCFNFRGSPNDNEPKPAAMVSQRLAKIMSAVLESYASEDRHHLDYVGISYSEEFRRYVNLVHDLHRVNVVVLSADEKLAFFLNLYNAMVIHAVIRVGHPGGVIDRRSFFSDFQYLVGGHHYSLTSIQNGILRSNRRPPYSLVKSFSAGDKRLEHIGLRASDNVNKIVELFAQHSAALVPGGLLLPVDCEAEEEEDWETQQKLGLMVQSVEICTNCIPTWSCVFLPAISTGMGVPVVFKTMRGWDFGNPLFKILYAMTPRKWENSVSDHVHRKLALTKFNQLIHFGLCNGTRSSPIVRFFTSQGVEAELRYATREFFQGDGMEVDLAKRTVHLTRIMKW